MVVFDGSAAQSDPIVELARAQNIVAGQTVRAVNAAGLSHSDLSTECNDASVLVSRNEVAKKTLIFQCLASPFNLGGGQDLWVGRVRYGNAGKNSRHHSDNRRDVHATLSSGQIV